MSGLVERLLQQAQNASLASKMTARAKSLRQGHKPPRDDLYAWAAPEQTLEAQAAARITALEAENERMKLEVEKHEALHDSAYYAGMKTGWNFGVADDVEGYNRARESTEHIAELRRIREARQALGGPHDAD